MSGGEHLGKTAGLVIGHHRRHRHHQSLVDRNALRLSTAAHHAHHPVAHVEAGCAWTHGGYDAGELKPRDVRRRTGRGRIEPRYLQAIGAVDSG